MSELTVEQVEELNIEMEAWNSSYHDKYKPLFADWHRQREELEQYKKGYWGNPCSVHEKIDAWVTSVRVDEEGLHCFGCFLNSRFVLQTEGNRRLMEDMEGFTDKIESLEAEVERLREAVEFYADEAVYEVVPTPNDPTTVWKCRIEEDKGKIAQAAIEKGPQP